MKSYSPDECAISFCCINFEKRKEILYVSSRTRHVEQSTEHNFAFAKRIATVPMQQTKVTSFRLCKKFHSSNKLCILFSFGYKLAQLA